MTIHDIGHDSHVGNVRKLNEDCYLVDADTGFCVLADGMGGHEGGEVASQIVVDCVSAEVRAGVAMADAIISAHEAVLEAARTGKGRKGMGSTAIALKVQEGEFEVVWVGDSRVYLWNGENLQQLTKDHSLVQHMVDQGTITAEEAVDHPQRNLVTQAIGMSELHKMEVGRIQGSVKPEYLFLLCSDGLSGEVSHAEIADVLRLELNSQQKTDLLMKKALANGGSDNVTVVLLAANEAA